MKKKFYITEPYLLFDRKKSKRDIEGWFTHVDKKRHKHFQGICPCIPSKRFTALPRPTSCFLRLLVGPHTLPLICDFSCSFLFLFFLLEHNFVRKTETLIFKNKVSIFSGQKIRTYNNTYWKVNTDKIARFKLSLLTNCSSTKKKP